METIYGLLNQDTKRWWWHRKLREQGNVTEARKLERQSIKNNVKTIREALTMKEPNGK